MTIMDTTIVNVALPAIQGELNAGLATLQWVLDGYVLILATLLLSGGALVDRFGALRVFRTGITLFTLASLACGFAGNGALLVSARVAQGAGAALLVPAALALIAQAYLGAARVKAIAIAATVSASPQAFGPILGGTLVDTLGWRWIFFINLPLGLVTIALAARGLPAPVINRRRSLDIASQVVAALALGAITYGVIEAGRVGWRMAPLGCVVLGMALAVAFVLIERRAAQPILPLALLSGPRMGPYVLSGLLLFATYFGLVFSVNLYLQQVLNLSAGEAGLRLLPAAIPVFVLPLLVSRAAERLFTPVALTSVGLGLGVVGSLGVLLVGGNSALLMGFALAVLGAAVGVATAPQIALVISALPPEHAGIASSLVTVGRQTGFALGVAVLGSVAGAATDRIAGLHAGALLAAAASALALLLLAFAAKAGS